MAPRARKHTVLNRLGTEIRHRREKLGIPQQLLATKAGVHCNVVGRTERGTYNPTVLTLHAIAAALGTSLTGLLAQARPVPRARREKLKTG
jgi:transcriptional regulator with XRE-family HTH domain